MKKILVIGGTRYIGKGIVEKHLQDGDKIELVTRGVTIDSFPDSIKRTHLDLMNEKEVEKLFPTSDYDIVYDNMVLCPDHIKERLSKVSCDKYVMISTAGVYDNYHMNILEEEYDASKVSWKYCGYQGVEYDVRKRYAEAALVQDFSEVKNIRVRIPVVIGENDYTHRLEWYINHIIEQNPMDIPNLDIQMPFSYVDDVSEMIYQCANSNFTGAINGCMHRTVSIRSLIEYIQQKTGYTANLCTNGEEAPYKNSTSYSLNTDKAKELGIYFKDIESVYELIDRFIDRRMIN